MAGRLSMQPLLLGVFEMPRLGCCSQGLVFNRRLVPETVEWLREKESGKVHSLIEQYAEENQLPRWAMTPSLLQHVGRETFMEDDFWLTLDYNMTVRRQVWNFGFEDNTVPELGRLKQQAMISEQSLYGVREKINSWQR